MGIQLTFTDDNVKKNAFDFPKIKLANNETALLTVVESPWSEYVHNLQKPVLDSDNQVIMLTKDKKDGTQYQVPKTAWVSNPICLGNPEVLQKDGIDPDNCPACARAAAGERGFQPKRRFAVHVIRTATRAGSFDPLDPPSHQLFIWAFSDNIFDKLVNFNSKFGLTKTALELGPCTDANFQKAELGVANRMVIDQATIDAVFAEKNRAEDPTVFCGSRKTKQRVEDDLAIIDAEWAKSRGDVKSVAVTTTESLSAGLDALIKDEDDTVTGATTVKSVEPVTSFDGLEPKQKAPVAAPQQLSTDDLLDGLLD